VLRHYRADALRWALWVLGGATLAAYVLYTRAPHTLRFFGTTRMVWTTPCAAYGLLRFYSLVMRKDVHDSPTDMMLRDAPFVLNFLLWAAAVTLIIYFRR